MSLFRYLRKVYVGHRKQYPEYYNSLLEREISRLERKIASEEKHMAEISDSFFRNGGVCCPSCGEPGYSELMRAQERRERWLSVLKQKQVRRYTPGSSEP
jgi:hypothetical protein